MSELLPTGTVTLLLADVEGSTRLWETQPEEMTAAVARLDRTLSDIIAAHDGVRPVEQGEGDSFVVAFARASDAVACALELQRAPLAPIRLRIGVHTGEVQLRDEGNYIGPTINRTARLRDLAHGGQTVLSGTTESIGRRPAPRRRLADRSGHPPAARSAAPGTGGAAVPSRPSQRVPAASVPRIAVVARASSGAAHEFRRPRRADDRGAAAPGRQPAGDPDRCGRRGQDPAGGAGRGARSRASSATGCGMSIWRRSPIPDVVPVAVARALGLPDQPGRSTMDTLTAFHRRPSDAGGAGQLRAPARRERGAGRRRCWVPALG